MIDGVLVIPLEAHCDDRGYLVEIARRADDPEPHSVIQRFGQVFMVGDVARGVIRAFHKHTKGWDWFTDRPWQRQGRAGGRSGQQPVPR